jgi:hypothetical protein
MAASVISVNASGDNSARLKAAPADSIVQSLSVYRSPLLAIRNSPALRR